MSKGKRRIGERERTSEGKNEERGNEKREKV